MSEKNKIISCPNDCPNMLVFRRWALHKVQHMKWIWSHMWNIERISYWIRQFHYLFKVPLIWSLILAFEQLEVQLCQCFIVDHFGCCWFKRFNSTTLLWAKEHEIFNCIHYVLRFEHWRFCFHEVAWS